MARNYEVCGAKPPGANKWQSCNRKAGHTGQHADTKHPPMLYWRDTPLVPTENPTQGGAAKPRSRAV